MDPHDAAHAELARAESPSVHLGQPHWRTREFVEDEDLASLVGLSRAGVEPAWSVEGVAHSEPRPTR